METFCRRFIKRGRLISRGVLESLEGHWLNCSIRFDFKALNNVGEYEVLLVGLRLAKEMQVKKLLVNSDSQLVVS